jgi:hypothetical protein
MNIRRKQRTPLFVAALGLLLGATPAAADPITWDFTGVQGGAYGNGTYGNVRTFLAGGITLSVSAWGYTYGNPDNGMEAAALGRTTAGLGSCNQSEGVNCGARNNQVDNVGADDWILFIFSQAVDITAVTIDPYGGSYDRDVSYWAANVGPVTPPVNITGLSYSFLGPRTDQTYDAGSGPVNVGIAGGLVNALLFGARVESSFSASDYFRIVSLTADVPRTAAVPEPSSLVMMVVGLGTALKRKLRRAA